MKHNLPIASISAKKSQTASARVLTQGCQAFDSSVDFEPAIAFPELHGVFAAYLLRATSSLDRSQLRAKPSSQAEQLATF